MKLEDLEGFIAKHGWNCQHCGNHEFEIEEYADTGWCAVSATPYVTYKKKKGALFRVWNRLSRVHDTVLEVLCHHKIRRCQDCRCHRNEIKRLASAKDRRGFIVC